MSDDGFDHYRDILARLPKLRRHKTGYSFRCPFGDRHRSGIDKNPSATVWIGRTGQLCIGCFGCHAEFAEFVEHTGVPAHQWFPDRERFADFDAARIDRTPKRVASFEYEDADGKWVGTKTRWVPGKDGRPKSFDWKWSESGMTEDTCPLYRLPQLVKADRDMPVFVVEGEGKADVVRRYGFHATCAPHGSNQWLDAHSETLAGRWCVVLPDHDRTGRDYSEKVAGRLLDTAAKVSLVRAGRDGYTPPECGGDVKDWLKTVADPRASLRVLLKVAPAFRRLRQDEEFFA